MKPPNLQWGIDPGNSICGVVCLSGRTVIRAVNVPPQDVYDYIIQESGGRTIAIAIEDISGYSVPLSKDVIETCKFIGELVYRLRVTPSVAAISQIPRATIKKAVFDGLPGVCIPRIEKKMALLHNRKVRKGERGLMKQDGTMYLPSFKYVDDRIVIAAVKEVLKIPTPKPGKRNIYGLTGHSWQALAVACFQIGIFQKNE